MKLEIDTESRRGEGEKDSLSRGNRHGARNELSPGLEQEIHKMIREHLVTLQSNRSINASQETTDKE